MELFLNEAHNTVYLSKAELASAQLRTDILTVYDLCIEEWIPATRDEPAIVNVAASFHCTHNTKVGFCLMIIGRNRAGVSLWACALSGSLEPSEAYEYADSVLISKRAIREVHDFTLILHGGPPDGPPEGSGSEPTSVPAG